MSAYDSDFHAWAHAQADALRRRSANEIDWENVAEEIESLGKQQVAELTNRLAVLIGHLLKWRHQPERRGRSWLNTVHEQRRRITRHIRDNPSLKAVEEAVFLDAYGDARFQAARDMDVEADHFPPAPGFTLDEVLRADWLPHTEEVAEPTG